jgi:hypothetical protein
MEAFHATTFTLLRFAGFHLLRTVGRSSGLLWTMMEGLVVGAVIWALVGSRKNTEGDRK